MDYIKKFDFISYKAHFTFNDKGDKRYKTLMGGILSLISLIISILHLMIKEIKDIKH